MFFFLRNLIKPKLYTSNHLILLDRLLQNSTFKFPISERSILFSRFNSMIIQLGMFCVYVYHSIKSYVIDL